MEFNRRTKAVAVKGYTGMNFLGVDLGV